MSYPVQQQPPPTYPAAPVGYAPATGYVQPMPLPRSFRESPVQMQCFACNQNIVTRLDYETGMMAWVACLVLFGMGFFLLVTWFVCCIPFCITSLKDVNHHCPNCNQLLGKYNRMG